MRRCHRRRGEASRCMPLSTLSQHAAAHPHLLHISSCTEWWITVLHAKAAQLRQVVGLSNPYKQHDRLRKAAARKAFGSDSAGHGERIGPLQRARDALQTVPVTSA